MRCIIVLSFCLAPLSFSAAFATPTTRSHVTSAISLSILVKQDRAPFPLLAYISPEDKEKNEVESAATSPTAVQTKTPLVPQVGDMVRYYDLDGGNVRGQECVGRISFLIATSGTKSGFLAELTPMEDLGDGYYGEYSSTKKFLSQSVDRDVAEVSPLRASFVRSEQAYKIPVTKDGKLSVRQKQYDLDGWKGPREIPVDPEILAADGLNYQSIKFNLFKNTAIAGVLGTISVNVVQGSEDAGVYLAGIMASLAYLLFLSIKTDTIGQQGNNLGSRVSSLRFAMPLFLILGVSIFNKSLGDANPMAESDNIFETVTPEQFTCAALGFLTYRVPLVLGQLKEALRGDTSKETDTSFLPGSAGVALQLATGRSTKNEGSSISSEEDSVPVLLVSGPQATGRSDLVARLIELDDRIVAPSVIDRINDGATFERLQSKDEFLQVVEGRFGLTRQAILEAGPKATRLAIDNALKDAENESSTSSISVGPKAVVVDADVALAKRLQSSLSGARLVGVWVGLDSVAAFENRLLAEITNGSIQIPEGESKESVVRARIKEIVNEIDFGLSSGIFEFTILNSDPEKSLQELQEAVGYCFK